jgi:phage terminase small subunit
MRGRKPKPTELKELLGNPGHRPLNLDEPKPEGDLQRPKYLKAKAKKLFDAKAEQMPWLKSVDSEALARWATLEAAFQKSPEQMTASMLARIDSLEARLGMDPSSRSRMNVKAFEKRPDGDNAEKAKPSKDPADKYFGGNRSIQ